MRTTLDELLDPNGPLGGRPVMADGATGTNYFQMGLESGDAPETWLTLHPDRVTSLHQAFVDAGSDIILTNTFGCNRYRLALHGAADQTYELAKTGAALARAVADGADRPVLVGGSVGPTGELMEPLGTLTHDNAVAAFVEEMKGLRDGGADVMWIETMSAAEEMRAAAAAAISLSLPYVVTGSFDTAGRTMMGIMPGDLLGVFDGLEPKPRATGANCGVGASDIVVTMLHMSAAHPDATLISKGNCGVPEFHGTEIHYTGTPEIMGRYATLAADAGARIIGGCCGTSPDHLRAIRSAIDSWQPAARPATKAVVDQLGPLVNSEPTETPTGDSAPRRRKRDGRSGRSS